MYEFEDVPKRVTNSIGGSSPCRIAARSPDLNNFHYGIPIVIDSSLVDLERPTIWNSRQTSSSFPDSRNCSMNNRHVDTFYDPDVFLPS
jgi:hypothetical protein